MAQPFSVVTNTNTVGYDKSLVDSVDQKIGLFSPTDTPFMANMSAEKASQRKEEWLEDVLDDVEENAQVEAFDDVSAETAPPSRADNVTQILKKNFSVSGTAEAVKLHGRSSELNRLRGLKTKSLARDMEFAFLNGVRTAVNVNPRKMDGAFQFAGTTYNFNNARAATNQMTEKVLLDVMQGVWDKGVTPDTVMVPMTQKRKISAFTDEGRLTITQNADAKKVTMSVRVIETDMGTVVVMANRFIQSRDAAGALVALTYSGVKYNRGLVYRREIFKRRTLRPVKEVALAKTGDSDKYMLVSETTLQCSSTKGVGVIDNLSETSAP